MAPPVRSQRASNYRFARSCGCAVSRYTRQKQEHFVCLTLDGANRLIAKRVITIGTLTSSLVHPREVFAEAITDRAASILVAHNHPSGNLEASQMDKKITEQLRSAGQILGIEVIDHIIVTNESNTTIL